MYVMANDGNMPKVFGKLHPKYNTPYISILVVGILGVVLISTGSIAILAAMCAFCQMTCYIIGYISYLMLKKKEPNLERPFKVPFGTFGAYFSIVAYFALAILALDMNALPFNLGFDAICIIYYFLFVRKRPIPQDAVDVELLTLQSADPTAEEKAALDKQFKVWRIGAIGVFVAALFLFVVSYII
jgi:APA family basic amino acid/polyamine antiporter